MTIWYVVVAMWDLIAMHYAARLFINCFWPTLSSVNTYFTWDTKRHPKSAVFLDKNEDFGWCSSRNLHSLSRACQCMKWTASGMNLIWIAELDERSATMFQNVAVKGIRRGSICCSLRKDSPSGHDSDGRKRSQVCCVLCILVTLRFTRFRCWNLSCADHW